MLYASAPPTHNLVHDCTRVNTGVANACVRTKGAAPPDENCMIGLTLSLDSPLISGNYREMTSKNKIIYNDAWHA